uniref:RHS repeat domain-containing protein n=2 Tax=Paraburkholderia terricola TaxID=169427 RepID=UPI00286B37DA|nr:RHS repeat domain-containing protein [Paraburkholderia terricola]
MISFSGCSRSGSGPRCESGLKMAGRVAGAGALVMACLSGAATSAHADEIIYGYDALGRLTSVALAGDTAYYDYDAAGNITAIRRQAAVSSAAGDASSLSSNADAAVSTFAKTD